jgi:predicted nucleic acid-binding protein
MTEGGTAEGLNHPLKQWARAGWVSGSELITSLERRSVPIGAYDLLIAGHARSRGLVVVTGNLREFNRVDGLRAEDWLAASP